MRAIDADAIPYTMLYKEDWLKGTGVEKPGVWKDTIDAMPTIEPERKKGVWLDEVGGNIQKDDYCAHCSACGVMSEYLTAYCGNCGADMRGTWKQ